MEAVLWREVENCYAVRSIFNKQRYTILMMRATQVSRINVPKVDTN